MPPGLAWEPVSNANLLAPPRPPGWGSEGRVSSCLPGHAEGHSGVHTSVLGMLL